MNQHAFDKQPNSSHSTEDASVSFNHKIDLVLDYIINRSSVAPDGFAFRVDWDEMQIVSDLGAGSLRDFVGGVLHFEYDVIDFVDAEVNDSSYLSGETFIKLNNTELHRFLIDTGRLQKNKGTSPLPAEDEKTSEPASKPVFSDRNTLDSLINNKGTMLSQLIAEVFVELVKKTDTPPKTKDVWKALYELNEKKDNKADFISSMDRKKGIIWHSPSQKEKGEPKSSQSFKSFGSAISNLRKEYREHLEATSSFQF